MCRRKEAHHSRSMRLLTSAASYTRILWPFTCPDGQILTQISQSEKGQARTINTDDKESLRQDMNRKMQRLAAKATYKQRKIIVEPVLGQIKNSGFRNFSVRGKDKVAGEFSIVCAAHNFKKIAKAILTGLIRPEFGNSATQPTI